MGGEEGKNQKNDSEVGSLSNDTKAVPLQNGICQDGKDGLCAELELTAAHKMGDPRFKVLFLESPILSVYLNCLCGSFFLFFPLRVCRMGKGRI